MPKVVAPASQGRRHRLVRRQTFGERVAAFLHPLDNLLSASLLLETYDWEALGESVATPAGITLNLLLMIAKSYATKFNWSSRSRDFDVFAQPGADYSQGSTFGGFMSLLSWILLGFSLFNSVYTLNRTRSYRLFEAKLDDIPPTPSARRVRVSSAPNESSPARLFKSVFQNLPYAQADRFNDGVTEDEVWEVAMWDPPQFNLRLVSLFSPTHVALIWMTLPYVPSSSSQAYYGEPNSSAAQNKLGTLWQLTVTLILLTVQSITISTAFKHQIKDQKYLNGQVFNEYNKKFVDPRLNVLKRDVATSTDNNGTVEVTSATLSDGFRPKPNPAYAKHTYSTYSTPNGYFGFKSSQDGVDTYTPYRKVSNQPVFSTGTNTTSIPRPSSNLRKSYGGEGNPFLGNGIASAGTSNASGTRSRSTSVGRASTPGGISVGVGPSAGTGLRKNNGNIWGGNVDYGVASPLRKSRRGI